MKILISETGKVTIIFSEDETKFALVVLRSLFAFTKQQFIGDAVKDLEDLLTPKVPYIITHKICEKCCCEIDLKKDQHLVKKGKYIHTVCPPLKSNSERDR